MRRSPLIMATALALALLPAAAHAAPTDKSPGEGKDLYQKNYSGKQLWAPTSTTPTWAAPTCPEPRSRGHG